MPKLGSWKKKSKHFQSPWSEMFLIIRPKQLTEIRIKYRQGSGHASRKSPTILEAFFVQVRVRIRDTFLEVFSLAWISNFCGHTLNYPVSKTLPCCCGHTLNYPVNITSQCCCGHTLNYPVNITSPCCCGHTLNYPVSITSPSSPSPSHP